MNIAEGWSTGTMALSNTSPTGELIKGAGCKCQSIVVDQDLCMDLRWFDDLMECDQFMYMLLHLAIPT